MLKIDVSPTFSWPVTVEIPQDGGKHVTGTITVTFNRLTDGQIQTAKVDDEEFCRALVAGWKGIADAQGADLPYSPQALDEVLAGPVGPYFRMGVIRAFFAATAGTGKQGRRGN